MKLRKADINGAAGWVVDYGVRDGARRRRYFLDLKEAEKALRDGQKAAKEVGQRWAELPPAKRADAVEIIREIEERGLTLRAVWDSFQNGTNANLTATKTLAEAIDELLRLKAGANRRPVYLASLEYYLRRFAQGRESKSISAVTLEEVEAFVNSAESPGSKATTMNRLGTLFSFSVRRDWCASNPIMRMDRPYVETGIPQILSIAEAKKVLGFTRDKMPRFLPWLTLALFAGVRPEEADSLTWKAISLDRGIVTLDAATSKVRFRRIIHLKPAAVEWLNLGGDIPLPQVTRRRCLRRLREVLGWPAWKKDCLRHSAASYWLASDPDPGRIALELGNSVGVLKKHYRELVSDRDAKAFWNLTPDKCEEASRA